MNAPKRLERIAYVARGSRNGSEEDGPKLLGETYQEFVNRLVRENIARKLTHEEAALTVLTGEELRSKALSLGQKTSGTKKELLSAIIASSGISAFSDLLQQRALYLQTEKAQEIVKSFKTNLAKLRSQWMNASFDALRVSDLKQAARLVWRFESLANEYCAHGMFEYLHLPQAAQVMLSKNKKLADGRTRIAHAMGHLWKGEVFGNWLEK